MRIYLAIVKLTAHFTAKLHQNIPNCSFFNSYDCSILRQKSLKDSRIWSNTKILTSEDLFILSKEIINKSHLNLLNNHVEVDLSYLRRENKPKPKFAKQR